MGLEFKDINEWTPSAISIVDVPYHPLAYFEVYENDEEFVKKFREDNKVKNMPDNPTTDGNNVTMSESFFEKLMNKVVSKRDPEPQQNQSSNNQQNNDNEEVTNAEILAAIQKQDERITALENGQKSEGDNTGEEDNTSTGDGETNSQNEGDETNSQNNNDGSTTQKTVELPLNEDGTLNLDDGVVAKYLPRFGSGSSNAVDPDLTRGTTPEESLNERTGRNSNGMSW